MRRKVVAVGLRSPSKNGRCWKCSSLHRSLAFCDTCGALQDLPPGLTHFDILSTPVSLIIDESALRQTYYQLSRRLHPDRFSTSRPPESTYSLRWTSALNRAFHTLRDPISRTRYLLQQVRGTSTKAASLEKEAMPLDLAETYFELQDVLAKDDGHDRVEAFREELLRRKEELEKKWRALAEAWDRGEDKEVLLGQLSSYLTTTRFLSSMVSDLEKKMGSKNADRRD